MCLLPQPAFAGVCFPYEIGIIVLMIYGGIIVLISTIICEYSNDRKISLKADIVALIAMLAIAGYYTSRTNNIDINFYTRTGYPLIASFFGYEIYLRGRFKTKWRYLLNPFFTTTFAMATMLILTIVSMKNWVLKTFLLDFFFTHSFEQWLNNTWYKWAS